MASLHHSQDATPSWPPRLQAPPAVASIPYSLVAGQPPRLQTPVVAAKRVLTHPYTAPSAATSDVVGFDAAYTQETLARHPFKNLMAQQMNMVNRWGVSVKKRVKKRVEKLQEFEDAYVQLEKMFFEERACLEKKYKECFEELYSRRRKIVTGVGEVDGIAQDFWLNAMKNNPTLALEIQKCDEEALLHLEDIKWSRLKDFKSFTIEFFFGANSFFKNSELSITFHVIHENEPIIEKATGTSIDWYAKKCLTKKRLIKKPKDGSKNSKTIRKTIDCMSFFNIFNPPDVPDGDILDDEVAIQWQAQIERYYRIGCTIRDKIIPHAVLWYTKEKTALSRYNWVKPVLMMRKMKKNEVLGLDSSMKGLSISDDEEEALGLDSSMGFVHI